MRTSSTASSRRGNAYRDKDIIQSVKLNDAKGTLSVTRVIKHAEGTRRLFQQQRPRVRLLQVRRLGAQLQRRARERPLSRGCSNQAQVSPGFLESMGPFKTVMLSCQMRYESAFDLFPRALIRAFECKRVALI